LSAAGAGLGLSRDGRILFLGKAVRAFLFGFLSVVVALHLAGRGLSTVRIGEVFTATMIEDAVLTMILAAMADRVGRRRILVATAPLLTLGGIALALAHRPWLLMLGAILGTLSPNGQEAGAFSPIEQAMLPEAVRPDVLPRAFAWYNVFGFLPAALGSLTAGGWLKAAGLLGLEAGAAYRGMLWLYAAGGLVLLVLYWQLSSASERRRPAAAAPLLGLHRSRKVVLQLSGLQALDSLAGSMVLQSLLAYWFHLRFGIEAQVLGPLFFGTNLLSALSFLAAARVAERIGLLNTMVFTHLPSNVLLLLVPLMPSFPLAAAVLLMRHVLSQMDVPTRQAYTMVLVVPDERPAAAGFTSSARALAQSLGPLCSGFAFAGAASGLPFFLAGGLKIVYDLSLYVRFRSVPLPSET
jgi:MFS family permease